MPHGIAFASEVLSKDALLFGANFSLFHSKARSLTMTTVIAGRFETLDQANAAMRALHQQASVNEDGMTTFYVGPPGQHDQHPLGGDEDADAKAEDAHSSSAAGAAIGAGIGLAGLAAGPIGAAAAVGVGAYTGALMGGLNGMDEGEKDEHGDPLMREAGVMLAVKLDDPAAEAPIVLALEQQGAKDIEKAEGEWTNGEWVDFNPVSPPQLIHPERD